MATVDVKGLIS